ncbi:Bro-N domain-containing protein [Weissella confusa]|uniref:Bro-N domain-containing protein n=1 Tax=Weissella confusa TaxID=1583 RepID=UPI001E375C23|nr:Bro-N domain-containing protein [Weissella confusa]
MENEVQVFSGLKIKEVNGQVMFDAESAAIGMGITTFAKSGKNYVRWPRVNEYLGLSTSGQLVKRGDFITEPQFYKLAIKANNETAERIVGAMLTDKTNVGNNYGLHKFNRTSPMTVAGCYIKCHSMNR